MSMPTIFKSEVGDILVALGRSAERASAAGALNPSSEYVLGYMAALEAVALSLGLSEAAHVPVSGYVQTPNSLNGSRFRANHQNK